MRIGYAGPVRASNAPIEAVRPLIIGCGQPEHNKKIMPLLVGGLNPMLHDSNVSKSRPIPFRSV